MWNIITRPSIRFWNYRQLCLLKQSNVKRMPMNKKITTNDNPLFLRVQCYNYIL